MADIYQDMVHRAAAVTASNRGATTASRSTRATAACMATRRWGDATPEVSRVIDTIIESAREKGLTRAKRRTLGHRPR